MLSQQVEQVTNLLTAITMTTLEHTQNSPKVQPAIITRGAADVYLQQH